MTLNLLINGNKSMTQRTTFWLKHITHTQRHRHTHTHTHTYTHKLFFHFGILLSYSNFHSPPSTIPRDVLNQAGEKLGRDMEGISLWM